MIDERRLIEAAFPLKQASLDSVHEKNVRHGHISTLHIWPARRPLAASRAALIATLLPDPGNDEERRRVLDKLGGRVVTVHKRKKLPSGRIEEVPVEETVGGILHWGRESSPDLEWFRQEIRQAYGGRAPRVLDPFAGGGSIPLEAMRLGCEVTAVDLNPVAWFILKCTLEYPQRLAGQHRPLPAFALESPEFMEAFFKSRGKLTKKQLERNLEAVQTRMFPPPDVDLAWHVRAWGWWVLQRAKADLERFYPTIDGKPAVAYLWARTVACKSCRATIPLLKTRWLCKKESKRVLLTMEPNAELTGVVFGIQHEVPQAPGNPARRREHDKRLGAGTMSRSGATCLCCEMIMTMEDIRLEGRAGRIGAVLRAVVLDGEDGKQYRLPTQNEISLVNEAESELAEVFAEVPFGQPRERTPGPAGPKRKSSSLPLYGLTEWQQVFTTRQLRALGAFLRETRSAAAAMREHGYPAEWVEALSAYLAIMFDRLANQGSALARWNQGGEKVEGTFARFALPVLWDFAEVNPLAETTGGYLSALEWVGLATGHVAAATSEAPRPTAIRQSAQCELPGQMDVIITDPPYYDAIIYSDMMDFFYVWLRRLLDGLSPDVSEAFGEPLAPKWDHASNVGELVDEPGRFGWNLATARTAYEDGMFQAFQACNRALAPNGRLVVVFAHKEPNAWETLVSAMIRAGFVVDGSWPIETERTARTRSLSSAALSSSVWLVCKKRPEAARPGWDNRVLEEMRAKITTRLRDFWDAGIRGPDFVWAATGPALEAYSQHPAVRKANEPGRLMSVSEFLRQVRRMVVDFVVGRVLSHNGDGEAASGLDDVTTYYLLHRNDFGLGEAPIGACILYALSCNLSDGALVDQYDLLVRSGGPSSGAEEDEEADLDGAEPETEAGGGSKVKLKPWQQRTRRGLGSEGPGGRPAPLIDQVHRLLHLWQAGDVAEVDAYLSARGLWRNALFHQLVQALIELAPAGSDERAKLESLSNHVRGRAAPAAPAADLFSFAVGRTDNGTRGRPAS